MSKLPARALRDLRVLVATPVALIVTLLFIVGASWGMSVFPREEIRPAVAQAQPITANQSTEFERWWDVQPVTPNFPYPNDGAKVLVVEFADYQCPQCRLQYFALKPIFDKYAGRPSDVKWALKQYPLNSECNPSVPSSFQSHPASCAAAAAAVMGRWKGLFDKMGDWMFLHQDELSPANVRSTAAEILKISNFDAQYPKAIQEVKTEAAIGSALAVNSTPTFFINGRRIPGGGLPPQYFEAAIELELKRAK